MCVTDFVSYRGITLTLNSRAVIGLASLLMTKNPRYLRNVPETKLIQSSSVLKFSCPVKAEVLAEKANS